jgi:isorenieratene synthase
MPSQDKSNQDGTSRTGRPPIVVVGGGIAGLCAAARLVEGDLPALVLERNPVSFGGRVCASPATVVRHAGREDVFPLEHGMHGWWRQYRNFLRFYEERGLLDALVPAYDQALVYRDSQELYRVNVGRRTQVTKLPEPLHHLPLFGDPTFRRLLSGKELRKFPRLVARVLEILRFDPYDPRALQRYDGQAVKDFLPGLPIIFQAFLRSLTRSGFFSDPPEVSLWAFLLSLQLYVFLRKEDQTFHFMRGPVATHFCEPVVADIRRGGGAAVRGVTVTGLTRRPEGGWELTWARTNGAVPVQDDPVGQFAAPTGVLSAGHLVLAADVEGAKRLAALSPELREATGDLQVFHGRGSTNIRLWWSRSPDEELAESGVFAGRFSADNFFWLHRIQDVFRAWHRETGGAVSECHIYAPQAMHALPDEELIGRVREDMEAAFPEVAGTCIHAAIVRNDATHINFPVGCGASFPPVETPWPDLALAGDWVDGGAPVLYMERACETGTQAANVVLAAHGRPTVPVLHPERAPGHVRFIQRVLRGGRRSRQPRPTPAG